MLPESFFDLPFTYAASVLPGPRHTRPRNVTLRADAIVEVPILEHGDFTKVAQLVRAPSPIGRPVEEPSSIYERDGKLFSPMTEGGRLIDAASFPELLRQASAPLATSWARGGLDPRRYPMRNGRHRRDDLETLSQLTLGDYAVRFEWPMPRAVKSNHDLAMGSAVAFLSEAFAVVDGHMWAECSEPVWEVRHDSQSRYKLVYELWPTPLRAHATFRLDQRERALDYARSRRRRIAPADQDPAVEILKPGAITRNDLTEITSAALSGWPRLRYWCWGRRAHPHDESAALLNHFHEGGQVAMHDLPTVMDEIAALANGKGASMAPRARNHLAIEAIFEGVKRWSYEKATVDPDIFNPIHSADWLALQDLDL